jgi:hypothetical protein
MPFYKRDHGDYKSKSYFIDVKNFTMKSITDETAKLVYKVFTEVYQM